MNSTSKWTKFGMVAVALLVGLMLVASTASAQGPGNGPQRPGRERGMRGGMGYGLGGPEDSLVAIAAKTLGIDQAMLVSTLNSGKTIADVAKDKGVALDKIVDAVVADRAERLKSAVAAGRMTQAQADAWLAQVKTHVTAQLSARFTPRGNGQGMGFVDANKDGVCDNCGMGQGNMQRGSRGGRR
ncbi:MAG: hypothetical protein IT324_13865 [Anaerolineae bacterium]|nr:hypothetical protein [Anaerolineae bacterium]